MRLAEMGFGVDGSHEAMIEALEAKANAESRQLVLVRSSCSYCRIVWSVLTTEDSSSGEASLSHSNLEKIN
eukprot:scaffold34823_cov160-Skeletonema_menzelii.AAC.3